MFLRQFGDRRLVLIIQCAWHDGLDDAKASIPFFPRRAPRLAPLMRAASRAPLPVPGGIVIVTTDPSSVAAASTFDSEQRHFIHADRHIELSGVMSILITAEKRMRLHPRLMMNKSPASPPAAFCATYL